MKRIFSFQSLILIGSLVCVALPSWAGLTLGVHSGHGQLGYSIGYHTGYHHGIGLGYTHHFSHRPMHQHRSSHVHSEDFQHAEYPPQPVHHGVPAQWPKRPMIRVSPFPPR